MDSTIRPVTTVCVFESGDKAHEAVRDLLANGITRGEISVFAHDSRGELSRELPETDDITKTTDGTTVGQNVAVGGGIGALGGLLMGLGALAIPGIGPIVAAGPLAATLAGALTGAAGGGLIGALKDAGVPDSDAEFYGDALKKGGVVLTIHSDSSRTDQIDHILREHRAHEVGERQRYANDPAHMTTTTHVHSDVPETIVRHPMSAEKVSTVDTDFRTKLQKDYDNA